MQEAASELGQHFIYASCAHAITKSEVLEAIGNGFYFPRQQAKNFDNLLDSLTTLIDRSGPQPGFVIVLDGLPCTHKFDKEARETLLDVFRDALALNRTSQKEPGETGRVNDRSGAGGIGGQFVVRFSDRD